MEQVLEFAFEKLDEHWIKFVTAAVFMGIGWILGKRRSRRNWEQREFFDRLNVSLNIIQDGKMLIRTLLEKRCEEIFLNQTASNHI
ncbi:MAG: hypothetical protein KDA78_21670, partial [Planctomycetaceae bacterium]|nr:hypothetical protein [Planctomycetaceae bacterium]